MAIIWANGLEEGEHRFNAFASAAISTTTPRSGLRKVHFNNGSVFAASYGRVDHTALASGWVYAAFQPITQWGAAHMVLALNDPGNTVSHLLVWYRNDGRFEVRRGTTVLGTSTTVVLPNEWCHICLEAVISDTVGVAKLYVNGNSTPEVSFSGDTRNGGSAATWAFTYFGNADSSQFSSITLAMDDMIIQDTTGSAPENAWLGDVGIDSGLPDGDGDDTAWAIGGSSPAATRWQSVDEVPGDDGVTLIETNGVGNRNLCTHAAVSTSVPVATFIAAMMTSRMAKQSATARTVTQKCKSGGTLLAGNTHTLTTSYVCYPSIFHDDPAAAAWTDANFNGAQAGVEVAS